MSACDFWRGDFAVSVVLVAAGCGGDGRGRTAPVVSTTAVASRGAIAHSLLLSPLVVHSVATLLRPRYVRLLRTQEKKDLIFSAALSVQRVYRGHLGRCEFRAERSRSDMEHTVGACIRVSAFLSHCLVVMLATSVPAMMVTMIFVKVIDGDDYSDWW